MTNIITCKSVNGYNPKEWFRCEYIYVKKPQAGEQCDRYTISPMKRCTEHNTHNLNRRKTYAQLKRNNKQQKLKYNNNNNNKK